MGGHGYSGSRVSCDITRLGDVFASIEPPTRRAASADLKIIDLLNRWVEPYDYNRLAAKQINEKRDGFADVYGRVISF